MAHIDRIAGGVTPRTARIGMDRTRFGEIAVSLFVLLLALTALAPPVALAALGGMLLAAGLTLAAGLWFTSWPRGAETGAWDLAGLCAFLGFTATLISNASVTAP